jgi:hypothetical protein
MNDPRVGDHATGLELQIEELVVRRTRAEARGWPDEARQLEEEIAALQLELADVAEEAIVTRYQPITVHGVETAGRLTHPAA